jgi:hypothetical protein
MKAIIIPWHDFSLNYFWNELDGSVAIFTNLQIVFFWSGVSQAVLKSPSAGISFSLW